MARELPLPSREGYRADENVPWLAGLRDLRSSSPEHQANDVVGVEEIGNLLTEWEVVGHRFAKGLRDARGDIDSDEAKRFERGLALLGRMVGCRTRHWTGNGEPDVLWVFVDGSAVVFEAKSEENPLHAVSLAAVRQVGSHPTFVRSKNVVVEGAAVHAVLATHQQRLHSDAKVHAANIYYIDVATIRSLFNCAATTLETVRSRAAGLTEEAQRELIAHPI